ncbi:MAG TPA: sulfite exporter TauE/SafE family protein [Burkholderiales bacterium]|nr:sulfite exporter TauE/SafE family protein [Burkholderiales bacterium]
MHLDLIANPWFYAVAIPAVILTGISKGGIGAAGGFSVPLLSLAISPVQAAAIMLPILILMDLIGVYAYRHHWDRRIMATIMPAGLAGIGIGWVTFNYLNDDWIRVLLGSIACGFVSWNVLAGLPAPAQPSQWKGYACAAGSGFTSFVAHAGGPPLAIYLLPQRLDKALYVGTTIIFFTAINAAKIVPYLMLGLFDARNVGTAVALLPVAVVGILLGIWVRKKLSTAWFYRIAYALMFVTGAKLLWDGIANLVAA